jgi:hypothetical protein
VREIGRTSRARDAKGSHPITGLIMHRNRDGRSAMVTRRPPDATKEGCRKATQRVNVSWSCSVSHEGKCSGGTGFVAAAVALELPRESRWRARLSPIVCVPYAARPVSVLPPAQPGVRRRPSRSFPRAGGAPSKVTRSP